MELLVQWISQLSTGVSFAAAKIGEKTPGGRLLACVSVGLTIAAFAFKITASEVQAARKRDEARAVQAAAADDAKQPDRRRPPLDERCLSVLREGLHEGLRRGEFWPAMHAAEALTLAGQGDEVLKTLRPLFPQETDDQRRCGLARELVRAGDRAYVRVLFEILGDENSNGRIHAAESLYKIAEVDDGALLRAAAESPNTILRLMASAALARGGNRQAQDNLRAALDSPDRDIRKIGAWTLGLVGETRDIPALHKLLKSEDDPLARAYLANALACLGDRGGRALLGQHLDSDDAAVRTYAADFAAYARCGEYQEKLIALLDDDVTDVRVRAAQALVALSLPPETLGLPLSRMRPAFAVDVYPADAERPRISEGSIIALRDGSLLYAVTEFRGGGADHAQAAIVGRISRDGGRTWEPQRVLQENIGKQNVMSVTLRRLPSASANGPKEPKSTRRPNVALPPLGMFFLVKNAADDLKAVLRISHDEGQTFGEPIVVTDAPGYHVMNNDRITQLRSGRLIAPTARCRDVSAGGEAAHFVSLAYLSDDGGRTWRAGAGHVDQPRRGAMEPEVVELLDGRVLMIVRTQLGQVATAVSSDGGDTWSPGEPLSVAAPEAPATIRRVPHTGDLLLVWNNRYEPGKPHQGRRTPLTAALSSDEGRTWRTVGDIETRDDQSFAYVSALFHQDRLLLGYYVRDDASGRISSRFRSLPVRSLYAD